MGVKREGCYSLKLNQKLRPGDSRNIMVFFF